MRILIVTATKPGSSRAPAEAFVRHVKEAFKKALRAHEKVEFIVRQHTELLEFLPPPPVPPAEADITASKYCIAAFDGLDFIFVDGDEQWLPWGPEVAPLLKLLHLSVLSQKCVFGCGCAVQLLTYLVQVGSAQVPVLNGGGLGGALDEFKPPPLGSGREKQGSHPTPTPAPNPTPNPNAAPNPNPDRSPWPRFGPRVAMCHVYPRASTLSSTLTLTQIPTLTRILTRILTLTQP